jgi:hypothetical protein
MTAKQDTFIIKLVGERLTALGMNDLSEAMATLPLDAMTPKDKSALIDKLLDCPIDGDDSGWCANRASDKQISFIEKMIGSCDRTDERTNATCETFEMLIGTKQMNKAAASGAIDILKGLPKAMTATGEQSGGPSGEGFFVKGDDIWKVKATKVGKLWAHRKVASGWEFDRAASFSLTDSDRITVEQAAAFGHRTGNCLICSRELTEQSSVERGIGPVCITKI